jgi:hypothetical protein
VEPLVTTADTGGASIASAPPSRTVRVWSGGLQWRRRTSLSEPVAPTPSYSAARQGPHQPSNGLGVPDPDASQGPNGPLGPLAERSIQQNDFNEFIRKQPS